MGTSLNSKGDDVFEGRGTDIYHVIITTQLLQPYG